LKKYFEEFNELSVHLRKKYDVPVISYEDPFQKEWNSENFEIKKLKNELGRMRNTSITKFLPDINLNNNINYNYKNNDNFRRITNYSCNFKGSAGLNKMKYSQSNKNIKNSNESFFINENSFNAFDTDRQDNSININNNNNNINLKNVNNNNDNNNENNNNENNNTIDIRLNILQRLSLMEDMRKLSTTKDNCNTFITNKNDKNDNNGNINNNNNNNNNELRISKLNIDDSNSINYNNNNNNNNNLVDNEYENLNTEQMFQKKEHFITLRKFRNPFVFETTNLTRFSNIENNESTKYQSEINMNNLSTKDSNLTFGFKNSQISQKIFKNKKNHFKPFKTDNSYKTIKDKDKNLQMSMARKLYKNKITEN